MSYISREAAIEAICKECNYDKADYMDCTERGWCGYMENIEQLPSAQPEERFEFGKWYNFERGYVLETTVHSFRILKDVEASSNE